MLRLFLRRSQSLNPVVLRGPLELFARCQSASSDPAPAQEDEKIKVIIEDTNKEEESARLAAFRKKMKEAMAKAELDTFTRVSTKTDEALPPWPNNVNPHTGEVGGPRGPEPTRYGDWERKGICVDF